MDALELLEGQHREVDRLFLRVEGARKEEQSEVFDTVAELLRQHAYIEQEVFYPGVRHAQTEPWVRDALEDHEVVERLLRDIEDTGVLHPSFFTKLTALREYVEEHVEDEEQALFPLVRELLSEGELDRLGRELEASFEEWEEEDPAETPTVEPRAQAVVESFFESPKG